MSEPEEITTGDREIRLLPIDKWEIRHTGRSTEGFTVRGYPAVYGQVSHDLGGFREQIAPGAFDEVLATNPDVHFVWDHDTRYVGARTTNGTLKLASDDRGLFMEAQVGNYTWAKDLRVALERHDIDQGSFSFNIADNGAELKSEDDGTLMQTIRNVGALYDVTVTAKGAYPQTTLAVVRSLAAATGRPLEEVEAALVAQDEGQREETEPRSVEDDEEFARWHAALATKVAARKATLAKFQERLEQLNGREDA